MTRATQRVYKRDKYIDKKIKKEIKEKKKK